MSTTPASYFATAAALKTGGESLRTILEALRADGASPLDLIRVVKRIEKVDVGVAVRHIQESALPDFDAGFTIVVPEGDPWYEQIFGASESSPVQDVEEN